MFDFFAPVLEFIHNLDTQLLLKEYGYFAILLLTFLEGETIVIIAGIAASRGLMDPLLIALCAFSGSFCSDQIMFSLGKYKGAAILQRFPRLNANMGKAKRLIKKYDSALILGFRFVYGVRNVTPIMLGISGTSHLKFFLLNFIGAGVWALAFTYGGFYAGYAFSHALENIGSAVFYFILALVVGGALFWYFRGRTGRKEARRLAAIGKPIQQADTARMATPKDTGPEGACSGATEPEIANAPRPGATSTSTPPANAASTAAPSANVPSTAPPSADAAPSTNVTPASGHDVPPPTGTAEKNQ